MSDKIALVVEDTDANRDFFERLLTQAGFNVLSASTGQETLAQVRGLATLDLAVMDMEVPGISGLQLTSQLRTRFSQACLIIATMHDETSLIESAFAKGCNVFLVKPHGFMELYTRLMNDGHVALRDGPSLVIDQYGPRPFLKA